MPSEIIKHLIHQAVDAIKVASAGGTQGRFVLHKLATGQFIATMTDDGVRRVASDFEMGLANVFVAR
jgi:hypothetical protein